MAFKGGKVFMPFGTPGGDVQPQAMLQVFLNINVFGMDPQSAIDAPRFANYSFPGSFEPHPYYPGRLYIENARRAMRRAKSSPTAATRSTSGRSRRGLRARCARSSRTTRTACCTAERTHAARRTCSAGRRRDERARKAGHDELAQRVALCCVLAAAWTSGAALASMPRVSHQSHSLDRRLHAGRHRRHARARGGAEAHRGVGAAGHRREPSRRRHEHRHGSCGESGAGRLHALHADGSERDQPHACIPSSTSTSCATSCTSPTSPRCPASSSCIRRCPRRT